VKIGPLKRDATRITAAEMKQMRTAGSLRSLSKYRNFERNINQV
jgi:hypothetical protein